MKRTLAHFALVIGASWLVTGASVGQVLFEDDFNDGEIDTAKWRVDDKPFETGAGDYEVIEADGVVTFSGSSNQNWWAGLALATIPTSTADRASTSRHNGWKGSTPILSGERPRHKWVMTVFPAITT